MPDELRLQWEMPDDIGSSQLAILAHEFSPDRKIHAYATNDGVFFHDRNRKKMLWSRTLVPVEPFNGIVHVALSDGPKHVAFVDTKGTLSIWEGLDAWVYAHITFTNGPPAKIVGLEWHTEGNDWKLLVFSENAIAHGATVKTMLRRFPVWYPSYTDQA